MATKLKLHIPVLVLLETGITTKNIYCFLSPPEYSTMNCSLPLFQGLSTSLQPSDILRITYLMVLIYHMASHFSTRNFICQVLIQVSSLNKSAWRMNESIEVSIERNVLLSSAKSLSESNCLCHLHKSKTESVRVWNLGGNLKGQSTTVNNFLLLPLFVLSLEGRFRRMTAIDHQPRMT